MDNNNSAQNNTGWSNHTTPVMRTPERRRSSSQGDATPRAPGHALSSAEFSASRIVDRHIL
ncbi:hypothetical protein BV20DRAFT_962765 [Pilatotrama ljubarskyi]|nr:hypothetical protein BV20DRAFT_962765 [Pilatotrama ljubarskyi]